MAHLTPQSKPPQASADSMTHAEAFAHRQREARKFHWNAMEALVMTIALVMAASVLLLGLLNAA